MVVLARTPFFFYYLYFLHVVGNLGLCLVLVIICEIYKTIVKVGITKNVLALTKNCIGDERIFKCFYPHQ